MIYPREGNVQRRQEEVDALNSKLSDAAGAVVALHPDVESIQISLSRQDHLGKQDYRFGPVLGEDWQGEATIRYRESNVATEFVFCKQRM